MPLSVGSISRKRVQIHVNGIVQGVGFRPFVYKLSQEYQLVGMVMNNGNGVTIEVEGDMTNIEAFLQEISLSPPPLARIDSMRSSTLPLQQDSTFQIIASHNSRSISTMVSPDKSLCADCYEEMNDSSNRRYRHPFINCTNCGPRYTIVTDLPYDRNNTSMRLFSLCPECQHEYNDPGNRRYHAQPLCCHQCGPTLRLVTVDGSAVKKNTILHTTALIRNGYILAIKGIGGFHLVCDATNEETVAALRRLKHRPAKPLAVMFDTIDAVKKEADLNDNDVKLLLCNERPIVIVSKNKISTLAPSIAPNIDRIGVFLPYTPLHELLLGALKGPMVATSANRSNIPIITEEEEIFKQLSTLTSHVLTHDRAIVNACDDSVMMSVGHKQLMLRMARGFAPRSFYKKQSIQKKILALGAQQKSTITLAFENSMVMSPHIGDLDTLEAMNFFENTLDSLCRLYRFTPDVIVCDKHPAYETSKWAQRYLLQHKNVELILVQHHYAHALACMAEYALEKRYIAFCFDGTGYGDDKTLWGGEVLLASPQEYERIFHFKELTLLGAHKAIKEPRRVALALLFEYMDLNTILKMSHPVVQSYTEKEIRVMYRMYEKQLNAPRTSSLGRLFDAVFALSGFTGTLSYEGESGLIMERLATSLGSSQGYSYTIEEGVISYSAMIKELLQEADNTVIASKFIKTISNIIIDIASRYPNLHVILSGGVFQNKVLLEEVMNGLDAQGQTYYIQQKTPVNDGGISLGQAYHAIHRSYNDA